MRVAIMGAPGAGKGTQAKLLAERKGIPHISTGDILRDAIDRKTDLGGQAHGYMERGQLVPDDVIVGIVRERIARPDCARGFIADGFPRTVAQAEALARIGQAPTAVVELVVPREDLVRRMTGRRVCRGCGTMFHVDFDPPKAANVCDRCAGQLYQRDDDLEATIRRRLEVYAEQTAPVLQHYRQAGLLRQVAGTGSREEVYGRVAATL